MSTTNKQPSALALAPCSAGTPLMRALTKGETVQRGDIFIDAGRRFEMDTRGFLLGVRCLGQTIRKDNGGWHRPSPNACDEPRP